MDTKEIIETMREEAEGSRGIFYENYGSGIHPVLLPLAELLKAASEEHPELVAQVADAIYNMR